MNNKQLYIKATERELEEWLVAFASRRKELFDVLRRAPTECPSELDYSLRMDIHRLHRLTEQLNDIFDVLQADAVLALQKHKAK